MPHLLVVLLPVVLATLTLGECKIRIGRQVTRGQDYCRQVSTQQKLTSEKCSRTRDSYTLRPWPILIRSAKGCLAIWHILHESKVIQVWVAIAEVGRQHAETHASNSC